METKQLNFESAMGRLEEIVAALEKGDASLSDSMALFQEGTGLLQRCGAMLDAAEQQVVRLRKGPDGAPEEESFDVEE